MDSSILPVLSPQEVEQASELIRRAQAPPTPESSPDDLRRMQHDLFEMQKRPEAWGLILPLLQSPDPTIQFFGAHTAQVKIARDWDSWPDEQAEHLRDLLVEITTIGINSGMGKFILRKLFVTLTSIALKLVPGKNRWPEWITASVTYFRGRNVPLEYVHNFLTIAAEEVLHADLVGPSKGQMNSSLHDGVPTVLHTLDLSFNRPVHERVNQLELQAAFHCFQAWLTQIPSNNLIDLLPIFMSYLTPTDEDDPIFVAASDSLQEIMQHSHLSDGSGAKVLTEPLLVWLETTGTRLIEASIASNNSGSPVSHSICKLMAALGEHSSLYIANNIASVLTVQPPNTHAQQAVPTSPYTKGVLVQHFLKQFLSYTGIPGYYGVDEEESELTLAFWFTLQEALWSADFYFPEDDNEEKERRAISQDGQEAEEITMAKAVYSQLVQVLRRKCAFPPNGGWAKDQLETFRSYRRDIGDTLINSYYVLRDVMMHYLVEDFRGRLLRDGEVEWNEVEATLHCIKCIQEAMEPQSSDPFLPQVFTSDVLQRIPIDGQKRLCRTMVNTIGAYSSWFATLPIAGPGTHDLLMGVVGYVADALADPSLCLEAADALRQLCDYNRKALAPHIGAFARLHAGINQIPETEKPKVLESICSVIQALPALEQIEPVQAIVSPLTQKLAESIQASTSAPEDARVVAAAQLEALTGVAKGLTRMSDALGGLDDDDGPSSESEDVNRARLDPRTEKMRTDIFFAIRSCLEAWSVDGTISASLNDIIKATTALPADMTVLTLPPGPLMELMCAALQRQVTGAWLAVSSILIALLNPPTFSMTKTTRPTLEAQNILDAALPIILQSGLGFLSQPGSLESNPDIVQDFMQCLQRVVQDFPEALFQVHPQLLEAVMNCSIACLSLQERYCVVKACHFLNLLINRSSVHEHLVPRRDQLMQTHGPPLVKAILKGTAGATPPSVLPTLAELMIVITTRLVSHTKKWVQAALFAPDFPQTKATDEDKHKLVKALAGAKNHKRVKDALNTFSIVARGLNNTNFGVSTISAL
ncbi:armadillo-type protein [Flagelloscypha sp. PMI_526]|nr:armadillo-type protein [Flagelloscypha sp. PMI_526]